jgi:hypothetical protein
MRKKLSKIEYWKKWEFFELLNDLHSALELLIKRNLSTKEADEFRIALEENIDDIEFGNQTDLSYIWMLFSTGGQWDVIMGQNDREIRERIFERTDRWKKNH